MRTARLANRVFGFVVGQLCLFALLGPTTAAGGEALQGEWEKVVAGAKREGQLGIVAEEIYEPVLEDFRRKYPEIRISQMGGPNVRERIQKLMAERRAELYLRDVFLWTPWSVLEEGIYQVFDPITQPCFRPRWSTSPNGGR
jgi:hypothetical protein